MNNNITEILSTNTWYHITIKQYNSNNNKIHVYLNGTYVTSFDFDFKLFDNNLVYSTLYLGTTIPNNSYNYCYNLNGFLHDLRIYNGILQKDDIKCLYNDQNINNLLYINKDIPPILK